MADTYVNATTTIVLVDGAVAETASAPTEFLSQADVVGDALRRLSRGTDFDSMSYQERVYEILDRTNNLLFRPEGAVDTRGWTLQENLLSRRMVRIAKEGVFWDCLHHSASDRRPTGIPGDFSPGFRDTDDRNARRLLAGLSGTGVDPYWLWRKVIQDYSRRHLTKEGDRLAAIDGITQKMSKLLDDRCYVGIWAKDAVRSLLWFVEPRRDGIIGTTKDSPQPRNFSSGGPLVPSWSWAKTGAPVEYRLWHPHARNVAGGVEKFAELAAVKSITAQPRFGTAFYNFDGLLRIEGSCTKAWLYLDVVFVPYSQDFGTVNAVFSGGATDLPQNPQDMRAAMRIFRRQNPHERLGFPQIPGLSRMASVLADSNDPLPEPPTLEAVRLLLLAKGGYNSLVGQYCLVLAKESPGRYRRVGICVFDAGQVCLSVSKGCASCAGPAEVRSCAGEFKTIQII